MAHTVEMGIAVTLRAQNDQVSAIKIPRIKCKAAKQPVPGIGSVPGQTTVACWRYLMLGAKNGQRDSGS